MAIPPYTDQYQYPFGQSSFGTRFGVVDQNHAIPHRGTDFIVAAGTNIPAVATGLVTMVQWSDVLGHVTVVATRTKKVHFGSRTVFFGYCHQSRQLVKVGQTVKRGTVLGQVGDTGSASRGAHLHLTGSWTPDGVFEGSAPFLFDPLPFIDAHNHSAPDRRA